MIVSGMGRLTKEPKMSYTPKGTAQTFISLAVNAGYGDKKETLWLNLAIWGAAAELLNNQLTKGQRLVFSADVTKMHGFQKTDESISVTMDGKILTFEFVDYAKKGEKETPFDAGEEVEVEEF